MAEFAHLMGWRIDSEVLPPSNGDRSTSPAAKCSSTPGQRRTERDACFLSPRSCAGCSRVSPNTSACARRAPSSRGVRAHGGQGTPTSEGTTADRVDGRGAPRALPPDVPIDSHTICGVPPSAIWSAQVSPSAWRLKPTRHKTQSVFEHYNFVSERDLRSAARQTGWPSPSCRRRRPSAPECACNRRSP